MEKYIDLSKTVKEEHPALYKKMPKWALKLSERIIMQKSLNRCIHNLRDCDAVGFTDGMLEQLNITLDIIGKDNLPENGRCFFAANHIFGILDGNILANIVGNKYGRFMAITNDGFNFVPQIKGMVTSVNVYGKSAKKQIMELDKIYKSDVPINHFPAGEVSRKYNGKIEDKAWHKSFITKAITEKRDIVPIFFHGRNSWFFYFMHSLRTFLGIKANIELVLLPRQMFKQRNKTLKVTIGKPIPWEELKKASSHNEAAKKVRAHLYTLKDNPGSELILG